MLVLVIAVALPCAARSLSTRAGDGEPTLEETVARICATIDSDSGAASTTLFTYNPAKDVYSQTWSAEWRKNGALERVPFEYKGWHRVVYVDASSILRGLTAKGR